MRSRSAHSNTPCRLRHDVEGNLDYFKRFVELSPVLHYAAENSERLVLIDGAYFVFGGDVIDKGNGDLRLCRHLVSLKRRYPGRVHLLVGNRDLNKLRYSAELSDSDMERPIETIPKPHWDTGAKPLLEYLEERAGVAQGMSSRERQERLAKVNTRAERLRWMHTFTLGCPHTFEFRRSELSLLAKQKSLTANPLSAALVMTMSFSLSVVMFSLVVHFGTTCAKALSLP